MQARTHGYFNTVHCKSKQKQFSPRHSQSSIYVLLRLLCSLAHIRAFRSEEKGQADPYG